MFDGGNLLKMLKMLKMMMFTSEELDGTSQSSFRSWVINQFSNINIPMMMIIIMIIKITIMMITSEELDDAPHHPGAWALSRMNSAGQHHKLLALANHHNHHDADVEHTYDEDEGVDDDKLNYF